MTDAKKSGNGVLSRRSKVLLALSGLLPASVVVWAMVRGETLREAQAQGAISVWGLEPGLLIVAMFWSGLAALIIAIISITLDVRHFRAH